MIYLNGLGRLLATTGKSVTNIANTLGAEIQIGTSGNDIFHGKATGTLRDTLIGGQGDDVYNLWSASDVVERAGEGIDTVISYLPNATILAENVENLTLAGGTSYFAVGNALDNIITAGQVGAEMDGGLGDDVLVGGAGADTMIVRPGEGLDAILNFNTAADKIRIAGFGLSSFDQVRAAMTQTGNDVTITLAPDQTLVLRNVQVGALTASNFALDIDRSQLKLIFDESFDALKTQADGGYWLTHFGNGNATDRLRAGSSEVYVDSGYAGTNGSALNINPFSIADGVLAITAAPAGDAAQYLSGRTYTSGVLSTNGAFSQQYGYFEMRAALPEGQGFLPAFWLKPKSGDWPPELDVMESLGKDPDTIYTTSHTAAGGSHVYTSDTTHIDASEMHTYALNWTKDWLIWYIDGAEVARMATSKDHAQEFYVMINLGVGGDWAGTPDATTGTGQMKIDYVRAYANSDTVSYTDHGNSIYLNQTTGVTSTGTDAANMMVGTINGDTLTGGNGNDTYIVNHKDDRIVEWVNGGKGGYDIVEASVNYTLADNVEELRLVGGARIGTGNSAANTLVGTEGNDQLYGMGGDDKLTGGLGNDLLDGGNGVDTMTGGRGDDTYYVDQPGDRVVELAGEGRDVLYSSVSYVMPDNVERLVLTGTAAINATGGAGNDELLGNDAANVLTGGAGDDILYGNGGDDTLTGGAGHDVMYGGDGNDTYIIDDSGDVVDEVAEWHNDGKGGIDTVRSSINYQLTANVERLVLTGTAAIKGIGNVLANTLTGNDGDNELYGMDGDDQLNGGGGHDKLDGGAGADIMQGGDGNDTYVVDNVGDRVVEYNNLGRGGVDAVYTSVSFTLGDYVENLRLNGFSALNGTGNSLNNHIAGNDAANILMGMAGDDTIYAEGGNDLIDGGYGADGMFGGDGDDVYIVDNVRDQVTEWYNGGKGGTDLVKSSVSFTLTDNVENLILTGTGDLVGTGSENHNVITGNSGNDRLYGMGGNDTLIGGVGNDTLDGGNGVDKMDGGNGNDTYYVNDAADKVIEAANNGRDMVYASVSYALSDNVEELRLTGSADLNGTGNALDNIVNGNAGDNRLYGLGGNDTLWGGNGNDFLDGGSGNDSMTGGDGNDTYVVDAIGDQVIEWSGAAAGIDTVLSSISYTLASTLENLTLTGTGAINATGNGANNILIGNAAANIIDGGGGNDTLTGGGGADLFTFRGASGNDRITDFDQNDKIDLSGWLYRGAADLKLISITDSADGAIISLDGRGSVQLLGVSVHDVALNSTGMVYHV